MRYPPWGVWLVGGDTPSTPLPAEWGDPPLGGWFWVGPGRGLRRVGVVWRADRDGGVPHSTILQPDEIKRILESSISSQNSPIEEFEVFKWKKSALRSTEFSLVSAHSFFL